MPAVRFPVTKMRDSRGAAPEPQCTHPAEDLAWSFERPLYCSLCDMNLQTQQPILIGDFPRFVRIRTGVARFADGWNVVVNFDGQVSVYDPTYATEAEAETKANELAAGYRAAIPWLMSAPEPERWPIIHADGEEPEYDPDEEYASDNADAWDGYDQ